MGVTIGGLDDSVDRGVVSVDWLMELEASELVVCDVNAADISALRFKDGPYGLTRAAVSVLSVEVANHSLGNGCSATFSFGTAVGKSCGGFDRKPSLYMSI